MPKSSPFLGLLAVAGADKRAAAHAETLARWDEMDAPTRAEALRNAGRHCGQAVDTLSAATSPSARIAAASVCAERPDLLAAPILLRLLADPDPAVRAATASTLHRLAAASAPDSPAHAALDAALAAALVAYPEHRNRAVIDSALAVADRPGPRLRDWLGDDSHPGHMTLRAVLRRDHGPGSRRRAAVLLNLPSFSAAALDRLLQPASPEEHAQTLSAWPALVLRPVAAATLVRLAAHQAARLLPPAASVGAMPEEARVGFARLAAHLRLPPPERVSLLAGRLTDASVRVRAAVVRALADAPPSTSARGLLHDFCFDSDPSIAAGAARALADAPPNRAASIVRSPHADARHVGAALAAAADPLESPVAARRLAADDPAAVLALLRARIEQGEADSRIAAIRTARRLGLGPSVEIELLGAAGSREDMRIPATAALALADSPHPTARQAAARLASHPDARVRANAVEALARLDPGAQVIEGKTIDQHARTRANALVALLRDPAARERGLAELDRMLADERPGHRLSALWAAERAAAVEAARAVARIAREDEDDDVRGRSVRCARTLLARMRPAAPAAVSP